MTEVRSVGERRSSPLSGPGEAGASAELERAYDVITDFASLVSFDL